LWWVRSGRSRCRGARCTSCRPVRKRVRARARVRVRARVRPRARVRVRVRVRFRVSWSPIGVRRVDLCQGEVRTYE